MTSESRWTPPGDDEPVGGPTPPPPPPWPRPGEFGPPAASPPMARPRTVAIASTLWICLGVVLVLGTIGYFGSGQSALSSDPAEPIAALVVIGIGVAFIILAIYLRRGRNGARIALTVLGSIMLLGIWTALLIVPALILQFRPDSNAWFYAVNPPPPVG